MMYLGWRVTWGGPLELWHLLGVVTVGIIAASLWWAWRKRR